MIKLLARFTKNTFALTRPVTSGPFREGAKCLILHPVGRSNAGPELELLYAEEAVGLAKSLSWILVKGPFWQKTNSDSEQPKNYTPYINKKEMANNIKKEGIINGDYIYTPCFQGVYWKGGIIVDPSQSSDEEEDLYDEWHDKLLRESLAKSYLVKVKNIAGSTFFTKGKMIEIGQYMKEARPDIVFMNTILTPLQQNKLEKRWNDIIQNKDDKVRKYMLKAFSKDPGEPTDLDTTTASGSDSEGIKRVVKPPRPVKVVDRFGVILQIFAQRAKSREAMIQLELAWLKHIRHRLIRDRDTGTITSLTQFFKGSVPFGSEEKREIVSSRPRGNRGAMSGSGETQLEIERRRLKDRFAKLNKELTEINARKAKDLLKSKKSAVVALIGYTNAGKTALLNKLAHSELESHDRLFETLSTATKLVRMSTGQKASFMDTVGFISKLPHELVESFKATLSELNTSNVIVHVRDISHPGTKAQRETVLKVLKEVMGVDVSKGGVKYVEVLNKIDLLDKEKVAETLQKEIEGKEYPVIGISAMKGNGIEELNEVLTNIVNELTGTKVRTLRISYAESGKRLKWLRDHANVLDNGLEHDEETGELKVKVVIEDGMLRAYKNAFSGKRK